MGLTIHDEQAHYARDAVRGGFDVRMSVTGSDGIPTPLRTFVPDTAIIEQVKDGEDPQRVLACLAIDDITRQALAFLVVD